MAWKRIGECNRCGHCCNMRLSTPKAWGEVKKIVKQSLGPKAVPDKWCPSFDVVGDGKLGCTRYHLRPQLCADFPRNPDDLKNLPLCSYSFVEVP